MFARSASSVFVTGRRGFINPALSLLFDSPFRSRLLWEKLIEPLFYARAASPLLKRVAAQAVAQGERRNSPHVLRRNLPAAFKRGQGAGGARDYYLSPVPVNLQLPADVGDSAQKLARELDAPDVLPRPRESPAQAL